MLLCTVIVYTDTQTDMQMDRWTCLLYSCRLHKPVTDWLETLPHSSDGLNM